MHAKKCKTMIVEGGLHSLVGLAFAESIGGAAAAFVGAEHMEACISDRQANSLVVLDALLQIKISWRDKKRATCLLPAPDGAVRVKACCKPERRLKMPSLHHAPVAHSSMFIGKTISERSLDTKYRGKISGSAVASVVCQSSSYSTSPSSNSSSSGSLESTIT